MLDLAAGEDNADLPDAIDLEGEEGADSVHILMSLDASLCGYWMKHPALHWSLWELWLLLYFPTGMMHGCPMADTPPSDPSSRVYLGKDQVCSHSHS